MRYHIALSRPFDLEKFHRDAQADQCPRHTMWELSQALEAAVHQPDATSATIQERILAQIIGQPDHWAMARSLASDLTTQDTVFCTGEDVGFPLAIISGKKRNRPKLAVYILEPKRFRVRNTIRFFQLNRSIDLFLTNTQLKANYLRQQFQLPPDKVFVVREQTDVQFFCPGPATPNKQRPIIASAGLEQRDYKTLAEATHDLDLDVKICAVSPNASAKTQVAFPDVMPINMSAHPQEWRQFRQLYRNANVVVISLLYNTYSAGLTTLMEALACHRPVIITRTPGLAEQFIDAGAVTGVNPGDAAGMRRAILEAINHPERAEAQAQKGYELILKEHTSDLYVNDLVNRLQKLSPKVENSTQPSSAKLS